LAVKTSNIGGANLDQLQPDRLRSHDEFPSTVWVRIEAVRDSTAAGSREALAELCQAYWQPVYAFIRRKGNDPDRAADLTQDFFALLIEPGALSTVFEGKGKFRSFLMAACTHFLSNRRLYERALKRGGGRSPISIDQLKTEKSIRIEPFHKVTPERVFLHQWATTLLDRVMARLQSEARMRGNARLFDQIRSTLLRSEPSRSYAEIALAVGVSQSNVKMTVSRYRNRYGILLREEIARTVNDPADIEQEITTLIEALAG
jgi:RNA polymerase sigma-70 factor (ECF subfamily)